MQKNDIHTSVPNTSIKEKIPRLLYVETGNDVDFFHQWVLRDGLNLRWMLMAGKSGKAIISSMFNNLS